MKLTWGKLVLVTTGGLVLSATIAAQQPAKPAQAPPDQPSMGEQFDKAHEGIYNKTDKAEDAACQQTFSLNDDIDRALVVRSSQVLGEFAGIAKSDAGEDRAPKQHV